MTRSTSLHTSPPPWTLTVPMKRVILVSVALLFATGSWAAFTAVYGPWAPDSAAVLGASLCVMAAVGITGMLVVASRWGLRLSALVAVIGPLLGVPSPVGLWWSLNLVASALVLIALLGSTTSGVIRKLPAADGPTPRVVVFSLALVSLPLPVAAASPAGLGVPEWTMIAAGTLATGMYTKAAPWALAVVRVVVPLTGVVAALIAGPPRGWLWLVLGIGLGVLAWHKDVRLAIRPLVQQGRRMPMLPEMVPTEILEAAGLDEKGRPTDR